MSTSAMFVAASPFARVLAPRLVEGCGHGPDEASRSAALRVAWSCHAGEELSLAASFSWMDIVAPIAVGGIWLWFFFGQLAKRPLVPVMDPFLEKAIEHGHGH